MSFQFIYLSFNVIFNAFPPKIACGPCQGLGLGLGVFICGNGHRVKNWRTVGQKVTYSGQKSDVRGAEKRLTGQNATLVLWIYISYRNGDILVVVNGFMYNYIPSVIISFANLFVVKSNCVKRTSVIEGRVLKIYPDWINYLRAKMIFAIFCYMMSCGMWCAVISVYDSLLMVHNIVFLQGKPKTWKETIWAYTQETTLHGVAYISTRSRSCLRR